MNKIFFLIFDGLADRPIPALGDKTPLQVAKIPNINRLAKEGRVGLQNAMSVGEYPTSEEAHFAIFGYDYKNDLPGRGVLEALGLGVNISKNDLVLRVDFGTVDEGLKVIDPRAGNIKSVKSFCEYLGEEKIGPFTFRLYPGLAHRAVLVISGTPVTKEIRHHSTIVTDTDPHKAKVHKGGGKVLTPLPIDNSLEAKMTAEALAKYQKITHAKLNDYVENKVRKRQGLRPANFILTRGAGFVKPVESFFDKYHLNAACVAGAPLYKGIARYFGMDLIDVAGATGGTDTDVAAKVSAGLHQLKSGYDFVFVHLKGTDVVAEEEGDWGKKIDFLEKADKAFEPLFSFDGTVVVTGDHATPCILKDHSEDSVPILIRGLGKDLVTKFNETDAVEGSLGHLFGPEIMPLVVGEKCLTL